MKGRNLTKEELITYLITLDQKLLEAIPEEAEISLSKEFEQKMAKLIKDEKKIIPFKKYKKYLNLAAAILILTTTMVVEQSPTAQAFIERKITEFREVFSYGTVIKLSAIGEGEKFRLIDPSYLPEGYEQKQRDYSLEDIMYNEVYYKNANGDEIRYSQSYIQATGMILDTENLEEDEMIEYKGQEYRLMLKNENYRVHWYDKDSTYWIDGNISKEDVIKMVESIIDNVNDK